MKQNAEAPKQQPEDPKLKMKNATMAMAGPKMQNASLYKLKTQTHTSKSSEENSLFSSFHSYALPRVLDIVPTVYSFVNHHSYYFVPSLFI